MSENTIRPPLKVLQAEIPFLTTGHILIDALDRIQGRMSFELGDASEDTYIRFLINRAKAALKHLDNEHLKELENETTRIRRYLIEVERYLNERESI